MTPQKIIFVVALAMHKLILTIYMWEILNFLKFFFGVHTFITIRTPYIDISVVIKKIRILGPRCHPPRIPF